MPSTHLARYRLNPNYATVMKQYINKLLAVGFIEFLKETTWLSPTVINVAINKDPYPLPFTNEVLNIVARYEVDYFLDGYSGYHQIFIALNDRYKIAFVID
jgi:hypothetical protein